MAVFVLATGQPSSQMQALRPCPAAAGLAGDSSAGRATSTRSSNSSCLAAVSFVAGAAVLGNRRLGAPTVQRARCLHVELMVRRAQEKSFEEMTPEEQLAALEAELEALEGDSDEEDMEEQADIRAGMLSQKVDQILSRAPTLEPSGVAASRSVARGDVGHIAVVGSKSSDAAKALLSALQKEAAEKGSSTPEWVDLAEAARLPFEKLDAMMAGAETAIVCPDTGDESSSTIQTNLAGLRAVLGSLPEDMTKVFLVSRTGAQENKGGFNVGAFFGQGSGPSWAELEDELTSTARKRSTNRPLRTIIVRVGAPATSPGRVQCPPADVPAGGKTSPTRVADALLQALSLGVNSNFSVLEEGSVAVEPDWTELLIPYVGPEVWRTQVDNANRAAFFVQEWASEFFGSSKNAVRHGVKTPVQYRITPSGVLFKFRPLGTLAEESFETLLEGGLEFIAEAPANGPPRLRVKRVAYGFKTTVKENSEKALLEKFEKDWAQVAK